MEFTKEFPSECYDKEIKIVLNYIDKLQKELEHKQETIDKIMKELLEEN